MELFYHEHADKNASQIIFDDFESSHILKSKRKKTGNEIHFTNGRGDLFKGIISETKPKTKCSCTWINHYPLSNNKFTLAVGFIRPNRLDFLIEKITELGIHKIIIFGSQNSNYFSDNTERWYKIARQAIKQSLRYYLPAIETFNNFDLFLDHCTAYDGKFIAGQNAETFVKEIDFNRYKNIIYIIGPEGGLTSTENKSANDIGFKSIKLGNYRLRTETAALALGALISSNIV
jgi:16S rRNA (uracil1498-N3)-methyltransferase